MQALQNHKDLPIEIALFFYSHSTIENTQLWLTFKYTCV